MFEVSERRSFVDLIRPPSGYRLEAALGTSCSLDFVALTAALMAMVDAELQGEGQRADPVECLQAITRMADRVQVFVQRARIASPREVSKITLLYDRIVHEVQLPDGGSFHPKLWVTYYRPRNTRDTAGRPEIVRLICASRNLTTSQCWEAFVALEGTVGTGTRSDALNTDIASCLESLVRPELRKAASYRALLAAVRKTQFTPATPLRGSARLRWQGPGSGALDQYLPKSGRKALVVSPFLGATFLRPIQAGYQEVIVISTQQALDEISDPQVQARLATGKSRAYVVEPVDSDDQGPVLDLHAKIFVFENTNERTVFIGSANGTRNAWHAGNVEVALQFAPGFSVETFCDKFVWRERVEGSEKKRELRGWIKEYERSARVKDEKDEAERLLDDIRLQVARLDLRASYDSKEQSLVLTAAGIPAYLADLISKWTETCNVMIGPLSEHRFPKAFQPLVALVEGTLAFSAIAPKDLTEFFLVQAIHHKTGIEQEFVVKAKTAFDRDQRDAELIQSLLTRDRLRAFLEAILFDASVRPTTTGRFQDGPGEEHQNRPLLSDLAIEDILRSCTEDPSRIDEINRLIRAVGRTDLIDGEFRAFWDTFVAAYDEAGRLEAHA